MPRELAWATGAMLGALSIPAYTQTVSHPPTLTVRLSPAGRGGAGGTIDTVDISIGFDTQAIAAGHPIVEMETIDTNVDTAASQIDVVRGQDAEGSFRLIPAAPSSPDDPKRWIADRRLSGHVTLAYTIAAHAVRPPRGPAPPLAASDDGHGFSGEGSILLLLPTGADRDYTTTIDWNLTNALPGSVGVSSLGQGHVGPVHLKQSEIRRLFFMAGKIGQWPRPSGNGFFSAWQGEPAFDPPALMRWTGRLHDRMTKFFAAAPTPYGVFLRYNPINAGGGVALYRSFVATFGAGDGGRIEKVRMTLSHEMIHTFQPRIADSAWFSEGVAVFYQARLPLRYGMITPEQFITDINYYAARYYTNALGKLPDKDIDPGFWRDTRIRTLAYDRGMLFLAALDDAIRHRSAGQRSLDDLVHAMLRAGRGNPISIVEWETLLRAELGEQGIKAYRDAMAGAVPMPSSGAFGPCFRRIDVPMRRYEVGFAPAVLGEPRRIVRGLVAGSAAAEAGLRNGDEIVVPVPQDGIQGNQLERLTLHILRDGKRFPITYLPRGETVDTPQWHRVAGVPDARCAI